MSETTPHGTDNRALVKNLKDQGKSISEIMQETGLKKPTVYAYLRPEVKVAKAKAKTPVKTDASLMVTPQANGTFLVKVPADKLAAVAKTLAA